MLSSGLGQYSGEKMVADIVVLLFVAAVVVRGYLRGLISQIATIGAALALWWLFDVWFPPVDSWLVGLHDAFATFEILRRLVAYSGAYVSILLLLAVVEHLLVERIGLLKAGNTWMGAALGFAKGLVYVTVAVWLTQVVVHGGEAVSEERQPDWMTDSVVFSQLALWNPVRVMSAREMLEQSGAEEWGRSNYAQLVQDPRVRALLQQRGLQLPSIPSKSGSSEAESDTEIVPSSEAQAPAADGPATSSEGAPPRE